MLLVTDLRDIPKLEKPCGLTIGSFDGVHLGHQMLLSYLDAKLPPDGLLTVFTFSNHPSHLFAPHAPTHLISPPLQKVKYLADHGADIIILIPFTKEFSQTPFEEFLALLKDHLGFSHLALGAGSTFGKEKKGSEPNVKALSQTLQFEVEYLQKYNLDGNLLSSGLVRTLIKEGNLKEVKKCLGRPYSLMGRLIPEKNHFLLPLPGICLPPAGNYAVHVKSGSKKEHSDVHVAHDHIRLSCPVEDLDVEIVF